MRPNVLIATQDRQLAHQAESALFRCRFAVTCVESGLAALNMARLILPEVILLDEFLPDLEGSWVCGILQAQPSTRHAQVCFFVRRSNTVAWNHFSRQPFVPGKTGFYRRAR